MMHYSYFPVHPFFPLQTSYFCNRVVIKGKAVQDNAESSTFAVRKHKKILTCRTTIIICMDITIMFQPHSVQFSFCASY